MGNRASNKYNLLLKKGPIVLKQNPYESDALAGQVFCITGAGSGLGAALAIQMASLGAHIILIGRSESKLSKTYDAIVNQGLTPPILFPFDLANLNQTVANGLAHAIAREYDRLDGIIHCAAYVGSLTPMMHYPESQWSRTMQINCHAPIILTQALFPLLKQQAVAHCVFINDTNAIEATAYWGAYAAAKQALSTTFKIWQKEVSQNTGVLFSECVPGPMQTALRANTYPGDASGTHPSPEKYLPMILNLILGR